MVWDTSREDDTLIATTGISDDTHREPVYKLHWVAVTGGKKYNVRVIVRYISVALFMLFIVTTTRNRHLCYDCYPWISFSKFFQVQR